MQDPDRKYVAVRKADGRKVFKPVGKPKRQANEGFWKTAKGRAILAARQREEDRQVWQRFDAWG